MEVRYPLDFHAKTKEAFLNYLYSDSEKQYEAEIAKQIQTNVNLRAGFDVMGSFAYYYRGQYYFNDVLGPREKQFAIIKHDYEPIEIYPELIDELHLTIQHLLDLKAEEKPVEIYINNALGMCKSIKDIIKLFPKKMSVLIPFKLEWKGVPHPFPHETVTLTDKDINNHLIEFQDLRGRMNARIILNQLFNKA